MRQALREHRPSAAVCAEKAYGQGELLYQTLSGAMHALLHTPG
ncbi:hypothetical protein [Thermomonospora umbrina]|uniref:Uncharacterized protein n=1 Tax=Thermomonospora umbrina TaxID=111806 RepID=A0A3D9SWX1_9ACTN|nr:hypothetical protein [Thermomonospora umbrina]REF00450.1 hypothetical protein DFJ69_5987 [Thermomonospora umbrina]